MKHLQNKRALVNFNLHLTAKEQKLVIYNSLHIVSPWALAWMSTLDFKQATGISIYLQLSNRGIA